MCKAHEENDQCHADDSSHVHGGEHGHEHSHNHSSFSHTHDEAETKAILNRLSKAIGHMEHIKRMVANGRDCSDVLVQLAAVRSAINSTGRELLRSHIRHCIVDSVKDGNMERLDELDFALSRLIK